MKKDLGKKVMNRGAGFILAAFACLSLMGVGFSVWSYGESAFSGADASANVAVADSYGLLTLSNQTGSCKICKYGFLNNSNEIVSSCGYTYTYELDQSSARALNKINADSASFKVLINDKTGSNSFVALFNKGYYSATASINYNNASTSAVSFSTDATSMSASIDVSSMTQNETESLSLSLVFSFDSSKQSVLETYLKTVNQTLGFDFVATLGME